MGNPTNMELVDFNGDSVVNAADIVSIIETIKYRKSIVGVWEVVNIEYNDPSITGIGRDIYLNADGTYKDPYYTGYWTLNDTTISVYYDDNDDKMAVHNVIKLTDTELVLQWFPKKFSTLIVHFKRKGYAV